MLVHLTIYFLLFLQPQLYHCQAGCSSIKPHTRLDCYPEVGANEQQCIARGCCWLPLNPYVQGSPSCYFPTNYTSYHVQNINETSTGFIAGLIKPSLLISSNEYSKLNFEFKEEGRGRVRLRFDIPSEPNRWQPPIPIAQPHPGSPSVHVELTESPFGIKIMRRTPGKEPLIELSALQSPSLIISDQFLQITFRLHAHVGFGLGERRTSFPHPLNRWQRMGLWTRDSAPMEGANLYGVHNMFMGITFEGTAFGLFLLNSNAQEVVLTPLPAITYRALGGILDFFLLTGPTPLDVIRQYYELIGHPMLPPYWSLGFHLCRYGYSSLQEVQDTVEHNRNVGVPIEVQWFDIDYMDKYKIWSIDPVRFNGLGKFIDQTLHARYGMKAVLMLDPAVSTQGESNYQPYKSGLELGVFINDSRTGKPIRGHVWPGETVFPDFSHPNAENWVFDLANTFHHHTPFDGLWIDMNEPASFDAGSTTSCDPLNKLDNPPFVPTILDNMLYAKTICPSALHFNTTHYNRHNMYGYDQARVTNKVLKLLFPGKRPFLLSRSTFSGSGRYTAHWSGDNLASWSDLKASIAQIINFNMFGIPMVGADICGFRGNTTEELCVRWTQLGAFYPFARNHNDLKSRPQDPAVWSEDAVKAIKEILELRYYLLPYWYSLFFRAHLYGEPVVRALAFNYPQDLNTHRIDSQFMIGHCILVTPVLEEGRTQVDGYVPAGEWINLSVGSRIRSHGERRYFNAPWNVIPILVRAGCIVPLQASAETTSIARKKGLGLLIVLSEVDDGTDAARKKCHAKGEIFWDDGESEPLNYIHTQFLVKNRSIIISPEGSSNASLDPNEIKLKFILVNGVYKKPTRVEMDGAALPFVFDVSLKTIRIECGDMCGVLTRKMHIEWFFTQ